MSGGVLKRLFHRAMQQLVGCGTSSCPYSEVVPSRPSSCFLVYRHTRCISPAVAGAPELLLERAHSGSGALSEGGDERAGGRRAPLAEGCEAWEFREKTQAEQPEEGGFGAHSVVG